MAVAHGYQTGVAHGDHRPIRFRAHPAPGPLRQLHGCPRHGQFVEGVAPLAIEPLGQGLLDRRARRRERQLVNDDVLAQRARQVYAFAKGLQAENEGARSGLDAPAVFPEQLGA